MTSSEEFWSLVATSTPDACWLWLGPTTHNGYGRYHRGSLDVRAHRHAYALAAGPIPDGMQIDHTCHERRCVNAAHLQAVTPRQNSENLAGAHRDSKTGVRGVYWSPRSERYIAEVYSGGKRHWVGSFTDLDEAARATSEARARLMPNSLADKGDPHAA